MIGPRILDGEKVEQPRRSTPTRDAIYLFACHVEWHSRGNIRAYSELLSVLDDRDGEIRLITETLLAEGSRHLPVTPHDGLLTSGS